MMLSTPFCGTTERSSRRPLSCRNLLLSMSSDLNVKYIDVDQLLTICKLLSSVTIHINWRYNMAVTDWVECSEAITPCMSCQQCGTTGIPNWRPVTVNWRRSSGRHVGLYARFSASQKGWDLTQQTSLCANSYLSSFRY